MTTGLILQDWCSTKIVEFFYIYGKIQRLSFVLSKVRQIISKPIVFKNIIEYSEFVNVSVLKKFLAKLHMVLEYLLLERS